MSPHSVTESPVEHPILRPGCADTDGTEDACPSLTICGVCEGYVCEDHSDLIDPAGDNDPQHLDSLGIVHRFCI